jgi:hypothetical protein
MIGRGAASVNPEDLVVPRQPTPYQEWDFEIPSAPRGGALG